MLKIPVWITIALVAVAIAAAGFILKEPQIKEVERINSLISLLACLGGFIAATFVIYSYYLTNRAFVASQRPALLLQVGNEVVKDHPGSTAPTHFTKIPYKNTTHNAFTDLSIEVRLQVGDQEADFDDLFTPGMYVAGQDERIRRFDTCAECAKRGVDLAENEALGHEVTLTLRFTYSFLGKTESHAVQAYRWQTPHGWVIR